MKKYRVIAAIVMVLVLCAGCAPHGGKISVSLMPTPTQEAPAKEELPVVPLEGLATELPEATAAAEETPAPETESTEPVQDPVTPKPESTATAKPAATQSPKPTQEPAQETEPSATAAPTAMPTDEPAATPTVKPTATSAATPTAAPSATTVRPILSPVSKFTSVAFVIIGSTVSLPGAEGASVSFC